MDNSEYFRPGATFRVVRTPCNLRGYAIGAQGEGLIWRKDLQLGDVITVEMNVFGYILWKTDSPIDPQGVSFHPSDWTSDDSWYQPDLGYLEPC